MGWRLHVLGFAVSINLAVARHIGCHPRCRSRNDPLGHADACSRRFHLDLSSGPRLDRNDRSSRLCAEQDRTWTYLARHHGRPRYDVECVVLGRSDSESQHLCGLLQVLPQGAVAEALEEGKGWTENVFFL